MAVLVMRLSGPWQAWGVDSRHERRETLSRPSASGVVGLLANALGRERDDDVSDLAGLPFGCRTERAGRVERDFHTVLIPGEKDSKLSERFYLADAAFLAAVEGPPGLMTELASALDRPARPLFLGRRSCPADDRILVAVVDDGSSLADVLTTHPAVVERVDEGARPWYRTAQPDEPSTLLPDRAASFAVGRRRHAPRPVTSGNLRPLTSAAAPDPFDSIDG